MSIPKYDEMYREFLDVLSDGETHKIGEIRDALAVIFHVSDNERKELLPSGKHPLFNNRVNWTSSYLKQAGLVQSPSRGICQITDAGKKVLAENVQTIDNKYLLNFDSFKNFLSRSAAASPSSAQNNAAGTNDSPGHLVGPGESPQDILDSAYAKIKENLIDDVLAEVMKQSPIFFEHLVVTLLTKMGYGSSLKGAGMVTAVLEMKGLMELSERISWVSI